jgi:hypothetical protein
VRGGLQGIESEERELSPPLFLIFILLLIAIRRRFRLKGSFLPRCPRGRPGSTPSPPPLPPSLLSFVVGVVDLPPHRILKKGLQEVRACQFTS